MLMTIKTNIEKEVEMQVEIFLTQNNTKEDYKKLIKRINNSCINPIPLIFQLLDRYYKEYNSVTFCTQLTDDNGNYNDNDHYHPTDDNIDNIIDWDHKQRCDTPFRCDDPNFVEYFNYCLKQNYIENVENFRFKLLFYIDYYFTDGWTPTYSIRKSKGIEYILLNWLEVIGSSILNNYVSEVDENGQTGICKMSIDNSFQNSCQYKTYPSALFEYFDVVPKEVTDRLNKSNIIYNKDNTLLK